MKTRHLFLLLVLGGLCTAMAPHADALFKLKDKTAQVNQVYMSRTEVTNYEYKAFLMALIEDGKADLVPQYAPDINVWTDDMSFGEPVRDNYFKHPAFDNYPVVGISYEAAVAYCEWLTESLGTRVGQKKKTDGRQYRFRLPTLQEWQTAARHDAPNDAYMSGGFPYPRNDKGEYMFNHKLGRGDYAGIPHGKSHEYEGYMITAPVEAFPQTDNGFYNLAGNVAEMVAEKGVAKGGSWFHESEMATIDAELNYEAPKSWLGFRFVVEPI